MRVPASKNSDFRRRWWPRWLIVGSETLPVLLRRNIGARRGIFAIRKGKGSSMSKVRALLAEDSYIILVGLETLLEENGIEVVGTAATLDSLFGLVEFKPDIAILDVNLNGEMVFPVADLLIERGIPIVFVTGYEAKKILPPHLLTSPVVQKPYDPDELLCVIENAIGHRGQANARRTSATSVWGSIGFSR